jgi:HEAT repeat protein
MRHSLNLLLEELGESAEMPVQASLYHLSSLNAEHVAYMREAWPCLPVELRRRLIARMVELAETDFEVDFGAVFRLGLEDEDTEVRTLAVEGLWEDEDVRLVPLLAARLREDEAATVRAAAATSMGRFILMGELEKIPHGPRALAYESLLAACQTADEHIDVRRRGLESLAYIGNETVAGLIREAYAAPEEKMHISAVFAMGRSADTRWACQVRQELFSPNPELRYEAARACGELQLLEATSELEELADDVDSEVREAALWALGQIGGDKAREILEHYCLAEDEATRLAAEAAMDQLEFLHGDLSELFTRPIGEADW